MLLREPHQELVQLGALALVELGEELVFEAAGERSELRERALAVGSELDDVAATVGRGAAALDEAALLELVEQARRPGAGGPPRNPRRPPRLARAPRPGR